MTQPSTAVPVEAMELAETIVKRVLGDHPNAGIKIALPSGTIPISPRDLTDLVQAAIDAQPEELPPSLMSEIECLVSRANAEVSSERRSTVAGFLADAGTTLKYGTIDALNERSKALPKPVTDLAENIVNGLMGKAAMCSPMLLREPLLKAVQASIDAQPKAPTPPVLTPLESLIVAGNRIRGTDGVTSEPASALRSLPRNILVDTTVNSGLAARMNLAENIVDSMVGPIGINRIAVRSKNANSWTELTRQALKGHVQASIDAQTPAVPPTVEKELERLLKLVKTGPSSRFYAGLQDALKTAFDASRGLAAVEHENVSTIGPSPQEALRRLIEQVKAATHLKYRVEAVGALETAVTVMTVGTLPVIIVPVDDLIKGVIRRLQNDVTVRPPERTDEAIGSLYSALSALTEDTKPISEAPVAGLAEKILVSLMGENKFMSVPLDREEVSRRIRAAIVIDKAEVGMRKVEAKVLSQNAEKFDVAAGSATVPDDAYKERLAAAVEICEQLAGVARYLATEDEDKGRFLGSLDGEELWSGVPGHLKKAMDAWADGLIRPGDDGS